MVDTIDLVKIKVLAKWLCNIIDEITYNKELSNQDIIEMLINVKSTIDEIDKLIMIVIRENTTSQKS